MFYGTLGVFISIYKTIPLFDIKNLSLVAPSVRKVPQGRGGAV
jgi:hypothetical protein